MAESDLQKKQIICAHVTFQRARVRHGRDRVAASGLSGKLRHHISAHVQEAKKELAL